MAFDGWSASSALAWWSAYNGVKHNREHEFEKASLGHAFAAVSACIVLLYAQFGGAGGFGVENSLSRMFDLSEKPTWRDSECYCALSDEAPQWTAASHPALQGL